MAEAVSCVLWVPIDVVKERLQVQRPGDSNSYKGSLHALRKIAAQEGLGSLYRGYGATLASFGPMSAINFAVYEQLKQQWLSSLGFGPADNLPFLPTLAR